MTEYIFDPNQLDFSHIEQRIANSADEMAMILFTSIYARVKYLDMQPFTEDELREELGNMEYDAMTKKALHWLAQL